MYIVTIYNYNFTKQVYSYLYTAKILIKKLITNFSYKLKTYRSISYMYNTSTNNKVSTDI